MLNSPRWLEVVQGQAPLVISIPHAGREVLEDCQKGLSDPYDGVRSDTDWALEKLYDFAHGLGATTVYTRLSRSMIDVNRDPSGTSLYPGQATTELCPTTDFDGNPLYKKGKAPDANEIARRLDAYFRPYHEALATQLARLKTAHKIVVLWDAHSIRSRIPRLFDGELPHLNFGTNDGASCAPSLIGRLEQIADRSPYSRVTNGRFKGGYITRHYGRPQDGVHAVQLEMAMRTYADERSVRDRADHQFAYFESVATRARKLLGELLKACVAFAAEEAA